MILLFPTFDVILVNHTIIQHHSFPLLYQLNHLNYLFQYHLLIVMEILDLEPNDLKIILQLQLHQLPLSFVISQYQYNHQQMNKYILFVNMDHQNHKILIHLDFVCSNNLLPFDPLHLLLHYKLDIFLIQIQYHYSFLATNIYI